MRDIYPVQMRFGLSATIPAMPQGMKKGGSAAVAPPPFFCGQWPRSANDQPRLALTIA